MIRERVCSYRAEHLDGGLFCIYYSMDHERAHIQVIPCFVTVTSKKIIGCFYLLNTDIVHAMRQHDNVICKKYLMLDPCDVLQKSAV